MSSLGCGFLVCFLIFGASAHVDAPNSLSSMKMRSLNDTIQPVKVIYMADVFGRRAKGLNRYSMVI